MSDHSNTVFILMAEDDPDDCLVISRALEEHRIINRVRFVSDGIELLKYLRNEGIYSDAIKNPLPTLILLDLNMPKMDGRETLKILKADPRLKSIPIVVLTTSKSEDDIAQCYAAGANSFITKPVTFEGLVAVIKNLKHYWFELVTLPDGSPLP